MYSDQRDNEGSALKWSKMLWPKSSNYMLSAKTGKILLGDDHRTTGWAITAILC